MLLDGVQMSPKDLRAFQAVSSSLKQLPQSLEEEIGAPEDASTAASGTSVMLLNSPPDPSSKHTKSYGKCDIYDLPIKVVFFHIFFMLTRG